MRYLSNLELLTITCHAAATQVPSSDVSLQRRVGQFGHFALGKEATAFPTVITMLENQEEIYGEG